MKRFFFDILLHRFFETYTMQNPYTLPKGYAIIILACLFQLLCFQSKAQVYNVNFNNISFLQANKVHKVGTDGSAAGNVTLYTNVITVGAQSFDCIVRTISLTNGTFTLPTTPGAGTIPFDYSSATGGGMSANEDRFFTPTFNFGTGGGSCRFQFEFILGGSYNNATNTGTRVLLQNVYINTYDIDGNGTNGTNQFNELNGFSSYSLGAGTTVGVSYNATTKLTRFLSSIFANISVVTDQTTRVRLNYSTMSIFDVIVGSQGPGAAYFFLDFGPGTATWTPSTTVAPSLDLNTVTAGPNNAASTCNMPVPIAYGTPNYTNSAGTVNDITMNFSSSQITNAANEIMWVAGSTTPANASIPLNFSTGSTSTFTLSGVTFRATTSVTSGVSTIVFTNNAGGSVTTAQAQALLSALRYQNLAATPTAGSRSFDFTLQEGAFVTNTGTFTATVSCPGVESTPDFNATFVSTAVAGNLSTNDRVPAGTLYGAAISLAGNPSTAVPAITAADGTYTFTASVAGVYRFNVPVCTPGNTSPNCPEVPLIITVTSPTLYTNNPVANIDRATTQVNTAVTLQTLANDRPGNNSPVALNPASVTVTSAPRYGTTSVNPTTGNITYTPGTGYTGYDTLTYQVCDQASPTPRCATSYQIITIQPTGIANNTASADDFTTTRLNTAIAGNVRTNDNDPQSHTQSVTPQNTTIPGRGTLVLAADGSYTFTPASGYSGPVNFPYQICDNGTPVACTNATLYILIYSSSTLPLDITSFTATIANNDTRLLWTSENQVNVSHFDIERMAEGAATYTKIGEVAVNNSTSGTYSYIDNNARQTFTKGYYRLKVVDNDGSYKYSRVLLVNFGDGVSFDVRPTVVRKGEPVNVLSAATASRTVYTASVYNSAGQSVYSWKLQPGITSQIPTQQLNAGTYVLKIVTAEGIVTQKIIIQ